MATATNHRVNLLVINKTDHQLLAAIYPHSFLEIAMQENLVWVKNISDKLISTAAVQRIPSLRLYTTEAGQLYPYGKLLPIGKLPVLDWQPLQRGLVVELPSINPNYFGMAQRLAVDLVPREVPENAVFLLVSLQDLQLYLESVAAWRLKTLKWVVIGQYHALLQGRPLAALSGQAYWRRGGHILPLGLDLEWPTLAQAFAKRLDATQEQWILWQKNGQYSLLPKQSFKPLTRSSFHQTLSLLTS